MADCVGLFYNLFSSRWYLIKLWLVDYIISVYKEIINFFLNIKKGIFTRELIAYFNREDSQSFVFLTSGLLQSVPLFLSPFVCILIEKYECRPVAFLGSLILFLSFILTRFFVNSLFTLNIIIGLMTSTGLACVYIPGKTLTLHIP